MALPTTGPISFQDFNTDRGLTATAQIDMDTAAIAYGIPDKPHIMSEFYGAIEGGTPVLTVPDPPTITNVFSGDGQVLVAFTAPANNGGSTITSYTATSSPGGITGTVSQSGSGNVNVTGLNNWTVYAFTITATNSIGTSNPSVASNSVTPKPTLYTHQLGYDELDGNEACAATQSAYYSECSLEALGNPCILLSSNTADVRASNGYYSNGDTIYYVEGNGLINSTLQCSPPPGPPPGPEPSLKSFESSNNSTEGGVCSEPNTSNQFWFFGTGEYPAIGDVCYGAENMSRVLSNGYYKMDNGSYIEVGSGGIVVDVQPCII